MHVPDGSPRGPRGQRKHSITGSETDPGTALLLNALTPSHKVGAAVPGGASYGFVSWRVAIPQEAPAIRIEKCQY
jgi:hypothetical protein